MSSVEMELRALRGSVEKVLVRLDGVAEQPRALKYRAAAKLLSVGLTELRRMVRRGIVKACRYEPGGHPRILMSEIVRLTTFAEKPRKAPTVRGHRPRKDASRAYDAEAEAEKVRRALRRRG